MPSKTEMNDELYDYFTGVAFREHPILEKLRKETFASVSAPGMQITPEQGAFMAMIVKLMGAKRTIEVGVFTGYSGLSVAMALPEDGEIIACDVNPDTTAIAQRYWKEAGMDHKIQLNIAPATQTLQGLLDDGQSGTFDFAFIDADKSNYDTYYEQCLQLVRQGGLVAVDNVLWHGAVIDESRQDEDTVAIRAINEKIRKDERVDLILVPIGDGITLARKR